MELYIGGTSQGKLQYVLNEKKLSESDAVNGNELPLDPPEGIKLLAHFELYIRRLILAGTDPAETVLLLAQRNPDIFIISDEIGSGIIPSDAFERNWREKTGRALCLLAPRAVHVTRIICGIGQKLK